jgi:hypothetical protein
MRSIDSTSASVTRQRGPVLRPTRPALASQIATAAGRGPNNFGPCAQTCGETGFVIYRGAPGNRPPTLITTDRVGGIYRCTRHYSGRLPDADPIDLQGGQHRRRTRPGGLTAGALSQMEAHKWTAIIPVGTLRGGLVTTGQDLHQSKDHRLGIAPELLPLLITVIVRDRQGGAHQPKAVFFSKSKERRPSTPQRRSN